MERIQTLAAFGWFSVHSDDKKKHARELSINQSILRFDVILQHDWPIEQCLRCFLWRENQESMFRSFHSFADKTNSEHLSKPLFKFIGKSLCVFWHSLNDTFASFKETKEKYVVGVRKGSGREFGRGRMEEVPFPPTCAPFALLACPNPLPLSFQTSATQARESLIRGSLELGLLLVTFFSTGFPFGISHC